MFVRHSAWLNTVPRSDIDPTKKRTEPYKTPTRTRLEQLQADGGKWRMPPVERGDYLLDYLWEVGPCGSERSVITWHELTAWQAGLGIELKPWELRTLRGLSRDYVNQLYSSEKVDCPPPYGRGRVINREAVAKKVAFNLSALAHSKGK